MLRFAPGRTGVSPVVVGTGAATGVTVARRRVQAENNREQNRNRLNADPNTGQQMNLIEAPAMENFQHFGANTLQQVTVPDVPLEKRHRSDYEKEQAMVTKYGETGPGEKLQKSIPQTQRDAVAKQQDIDGLPWEVRWKRNMIPTHEEVIAELRDRFELFEMDPIEREKSWYLHFRDRTYNARRDLLIWPQGCTDYLELYDEQGVRRTLPTDQRWADKSYKTLADAKYRDRLWMIESEEKKALDRHFDDEDDVLQECKESQDEIAQVFMGIQYGVIDIDPDQAAQAASGTADPLEVAKTKYKINEYAATQAITQHDENTEFDPVTGLPKSNRPPLKSGITVEQAAAVEMQALVTDEKVQNEAELAMVQRNQGAQQLAKSHLELSKKAGIDKPAIRTLAERRVEQIKEANVRLAEEKARLEGGEAPGALGDGADAPAALDASSSAATGGTSMTNSERAQAAFAKVAMDAKEAADSGDLGIDGGDSAKAHGTRVEAVEKIALAAAADADAAAASEQKATPPEDPPKPRRRIIAVEEPPAVVRQQAEKYEAEAKKAQEEAAAKASQAKRAGQEPMPKKSGFIEIPTRPEGAEPSTGTEIQYEIQDKVTAEMPDWYKEQALKSDPMIVSYGMTDDVLEKKPLPKVDWVREPEKVTEDKLMGADRARMGESAFDEIKSFVERQTPELATKVAYEGLPTYRDHVEAEQAKEDAIVDGKDTRSKSEKVKEERKKRQAEMRQSMDPALTLPNLPWETDPTRDPTRGVENVMEVTFDRKATEKVFKVYKEFLQQRLVELANMTASSSDERVEQFMRDGMENIRAGHVGDHPKVDPLIVDIFRIVFEAHLKQFLSDYFGFRGGRKADSDVLKAESEEMLKKATAKSKQLGQGFVDFLQEQTAVELDSVKKSPMQKYAILCREKAHEPCAKPFIRWIREDLTEFGRFEFNDAEQLETHKNAAMRTLNEAKYKTPRRLEGIKDGVRDQIVESFYHWGRGALVHHTGRHYWNFYLKFADTRFRAQAQEQYEEAWEVFMAFHKTSREVGVHIPVPFSEPLYEIADHEFIAGENAAVAEAAGDFEKAEKAWHGGTTLRWYPMFDETDYLLFMERRGKFSQAYDISDRVLEHVQKKTHPSVTPFPERARKWLENGPLTQETAEHLWMRYMGDLYIEHSDFCARAGKARTAQEYLDKGMNFYRIALRESKDRLPKTWIAPVLTRAKLLPRCATPSTDFNEYCDEVVRTTDAMYKLDGLGPKHWDDRPLQLHWRAALIHYCAFAFQAKVQREAMMRCGGIMTVSEMAAHNEEQSRVGFVGLKPIDHAANEVAEECWRPHLLRWRGLEKEGTDEWHMHNQMYFFFRVIPKDLEHLDRLWDDLKKTYDHHYMKSALGSRSSMRCFGDVLRRMCMLLLQGEQRHKKALLAELEKVDEKLHFAVPAEELRRTLSALELHLQDPSKPAYIFGTTMHHRNQERRWRTQHNPLLTNMSADQEYDSLRRRLAGSKAVGEDPTTPQERSALKAEKDDDNNSGVMSARTEVAKNTPSARDMFTKA